ncbi:MAG: PKD domain-containing protein [Bdellovibrio sp.]|nr:PKD domain-containing protein [Bdellovibrio sp.]
MKNFILLATTFTSLLCFPKAAIAANKPPQIDAYIVQAGPEQLQSVRVDLKNTKDTDGTISHTEINFGDGFISTNKNETHTYTRPGTYTITVRAWDNANAASTLQKQVEVNSDFKIIIPSVSPVFTKSNSQIASTYALNLNSQQLAKSYKVILTRTKTNNIVENLLAFLSRLLGLQNQYTTFSADVQINGISAFDVGQITDSTMSAEKFVALKSSNTITVEWGPKLTNSVAIEIKEVTLVRDTVAPTISVNPSSETITKNKNYTVTITDESRTSTFIYINGAANSSNSKSIGFLLPEGDNTVQIESTDSFGNKCAVFSQVGRKLQI